MPTPDDLAGGIPSDDGVDFIPGSSPASEQGEVRYLEAPASRFSFFDGFGEFDPRAGADDRRVKVSAADAVPGFLYESLVPSNGISLAILNPGADEKVEIKGGFLGPGRAWLPCPSTPSPASSNAWQEVASAFYDYSEFGIAGTISWNGWMDVGSADVTVRAVLSTTGAVLGSGTATGGSGQQAISFALSGLPSANDAIIIQTKNATTGSGAVIVAGFLSFEE